MKKSRVKSATTAPRVIAHSGGVPIVLVVSRLPAITGLKLETGKDDATSVAKVDKGDRLLRGERG